MLLQCFGGERLADVSGRHYAHCLADLAAWWLADRTEAVEEQASLGKELGLDLIAVWDPRGGLLVLTRTSDVS